MLIGIFYIFKNFNIWFSENYSRMQKRNAKVIKKYIKIEEYCIVFELEGGK